MSYITLSPLLYPPKKTRINKFRINSAERRKETENLKLVNIINSNKKFGKMQKFHNIKNRRRGGIILAQINNKKPAFDAESIKSDKARKRKTILDFEKERQLIKQAIEEVKKEKEKIIFIEPSDNKLINKNILNDKIRDAKSEIKKPYKNKEMELEEKTLDDYELNHLEYELAIKLDKRGFWKAYWSIIKRDELFIFTFLSWNDYNLFNIKLERFIFILLTIMVMNGFLFADKSIHKFYLNGVKYIFNQQLLQIILSIIITHVMDLILCFLSMTDRYIYEIKGLPKERATGSNIFVIIKRMRIRLVAFFVSIFFITLFYWYFVSSFCAVYHNTQKLYLIDCSLSFVLFLIDPFIIYAFITLLRFLSLKKISNKKIKCLYNLSRVFPMF